MQRIATARALILRPKVLMPDEPTANVDPASRLVVETIVRKAVAAGGSVDRTDEQFTHFRSGGTVLLCPARQGDFPVAVLPLDDVIISREPICSSIRSQLRGRVIQVQPKGALQRITVDCGLPIQVVITASAAEELGMETCREYVVAFKAFTVRL